MSEELPEEPVITGHTPSRVVTSVDDLVTITVDCLFDDFTTSASNYIAEEASAIVAADWAEHAPDVPL